MRRVLLTWISVSINAAVLIAQLPYPANTQVNYVRTWEATAPEQDANVLVNRPLKDVKMATQYFDGLGRPLQTVLMQGSLETGGTAADMVSPVLYDAFGREVQKYLPFAANNTGGNSSISNGGFKLNPFQQQQTFMNAQYGAQGETVFYGQTNYEASPLNRAEKAMAPGNSWTGSNRGVEMKYWNNTDADNVKIWECEDVAGGFGTYSLHTYNGGVYPAGQLYKNVTVDEHGKQVIAYKDKEAKVILKKIQLTAMADNGTGSDHTGWLCTYYIYDDLGRLRSVIQPEGVKKMTVDGWSLTATLLNEQCFRYEYDARGRMIMKKVPGAGEVYMVYDMRDRLVMTQDANQRAQGKWIVLKYDELNRPVETGLWTNGTAFTTHLSSAYTSSSYPATTSGYEELTKTFYDDYYWLGNYGNPLPATYDNSYDNYFQPASNTNWPYAQSNAQTANLKGTTTGSRIKVLGTSTYLYTISFYDEKGKVIQIQSTNISGGTDIMTTQYSWAGQPLLMVQKQQKAGTNTQTTVTVTQLTYDDLGRLVRTEKKVSNTNVNSGNMPAYKTIAENEYDKLGQLKKKKLAPAYNSGLGLETLNYEYNIRGWMLGMNRDYVRDATPPVGGAGGRYFGFDLGYDKANNNLIGGQTYANPQYNGNIEGMVWKSKGDGEKRKYDFYYDAANRLLRGDFTQYTSGTFNQAAGINYNVKMGDGLDVNSAYDYNGNIKRMQQWGLNITGSVQIDDLAYSYESISNKLKRVTESAIGGTPPTGGAGGGLGDFKDGTNTGTDDYSYDVNGNLVLDNNKNISSITYNHLNLPSVIAVTGKGTITYTYDASGNKLKKEVAETGQPVKATLYMGGAVYENDALQFIGHEEGRMRPSTVNGQPSIVFDYMLKDHLGNVRMVLTEEQKQDKYPVASMEDAKLAIEQQYYTINTGSIVEGSTVSGLPTYTNDNGIGNNPGDPPFEAGNSQKLYMINGNDAGKTGLGITLKVMAGDKIDVFGRSYFFQPDGGGQSTTSPADMVSEILNGLLGGPTGGAAAAAHGGVTATQLNALSATTGGILNMINQQATAVSSDLSTPRAYINCIFFDEQFKYIDGFFSQAGMQNQVKDHYTELQDKVAQKNGYVYIYVSNESPVNVFFDNLQVVHTRGAILEETHYYPFGLVQAGISSKALGFGAVYNKEMTFQAQRIDDELDLNWIQFKWRNHDLQIGRFIEVDPLSEKYDYNSTYAFSENKVTSHVELEGLEAVRFGLLQNIKNQLSNNSTNFSGNMSSTGMINNNRIVQNRIPRVENGRSTTEMAGIVLHRTVSGNSRGTLASFENTGNGTHFLVGKDGVIFQTASLNYGAHHFRPDKQINHFQLTKQNTISIEVVGFPIDKDGNLIKTKGEAVTWEPLTEKQTEAVAFLVNSLITTYGLSNDDIYNHEDIQVKTPLEGKFVQDAIQPYLSPLNNPQRPVYNGWFGLPQLLKAPDTYKNFRPKIKLSTGPN